jgi:hypothetical protein
MLVVVASPEQSTRCSTAPSSSPRTAAATAAMSRSRTRLTSPRWWLASAPPQSTVVSIACTKRCPVKPSFAAALLRLRERGFRIALDDYGEGSLKLSLLLNLRPERST